MYKIRDWLFIGKYSQIRVKDNLERNRISALLSLAEPIGHRGIESLHLKVVDGESARSDDIAAGVRFVREQKAAGQRVLIACGAGKSRSAMFTMAVLMEEENLTVFEAFREVYRQYRGAEPHHELVKSLAAYHGQELDLLDVWSGLNDVKKAINSGAGATS